MNALVIGCGSAGQRHGRVLEGLGLHVAYVCGREVSGRRCYRDVGEALAEERPGYVVVANRTQAHHEVVRRLAESGFTGKVLVEKPLFHELLPFPANTFESAHVAYNLRFDPVIRALREHTAGARVLTVECYVGQYLPDWRPGRDYRESYSASRAEGGGVLRDLSHELDYLDDLFGPWERVVAVGGHVSGLEIDSDDAFEALVRMARCPMVSIQMNYLDRAGRRSLVVNTEQHTYAADLVAGTLQIDRETQRFTVDIEETWRQEHLAVLEGRTGELCSIAAAMDVMEMIEAAERSIREEAWVRR